MTALLRRFPCDGPMCSSDLLVACVLACLAGACAGERPIEDAEASARSAPVTPPANPAPSATLLLPDAEAVPAAPSDAGFITDEECLARGGSIETEQTYADDGRRDPDVPLVPFRICRIPSPENGRECRGDAECGSGRCFCAGDLAGPDVARRRSDLTDRDGSPAVGVCSDEHLPPGSWFCLVEDGRAVLSGIIID